MPRKFSGNFFSRPRGPSNKSAKPSADLFARSQRRELGFRGAAAWWNTCGVTNLSSRLMGSTLRDRTGEKHGRLTVVKRGPKKGRKVHWWCECSCGRACTLVRSDALGNPTQSCGCLQRERSGEACRKRSTHGCSRTSGYLVWRAMKNRCYRKADLHFLDYGGRGIRVCDAWRYSFEAFSRDMGPPPGPGYSIERLDNDGHYEPGNCTWATCKHQARNRRSTVWVQCEGEVVSLAEAAERAGLAYKTAYSKMRRGTGFIRVEKSV